MILRMPSTRGLAKPLLPENIRFLAALLVMTSWTCVAHAQTAPTTMPQPIAEVQAALASLFTDPMTSFYENMPALIETAEKNKLTGKQVIEQAILYLGNIEAPAVARSGWTALLIPHLQLAFRLPTSGVMDAAVPFLEIPSNTKVFEVAGETLNVTGALDVAARFGTPASFVEIGSYLREHPKQLAPYALVSSIYRGHPSAALITMSGIHKTDAQTAERIRNWTAEVDGMIIDILSYKDTEEQRKRLLEIISQASESPHWFVRLYAAALVRRTELRRLDLPDLPEADESEMVRRFLEDFPLKGNKRDE